MTFLQYLTESHNYEEMFNIFKKLKSWKDSNLTHYIDWARKKLKKEDRIVWYLGWIRYKLLLTASRNTEYVQPEDLPIINAFLKKEKQNILKVTGKEVIFDAFKGASDFNSWMMTRLEHYFSLDLPEIQNHRFRPYEHPQELFNKFDEIEEKWRNEQEGTIPYTDNPLSNDTEFSKDNKDSIVDIIIDFHDGNYWINLNKSHCEVEGSAMGHCGNAASYQPDDRILSLRTLIKKSKKKKDWFWEPHLTFILHGNGFLGEMKGKGNQKPSEKYHKYIIALLENDMIKGISGGGYAPERNFSLSDLPKDQAEQLYTKKPSLMGMVEMRKKLGLNEKTIAVAKERFESLYGRPFEQVKGGIIFEKLKGTTIGEFLRDNPGERSRRGGDNDWYAKILDSEEILDVDITNEDIKTVLADILDPNKVRNRFMEKYKNDEDKIDELRANPLIDFIEENDEELYNAITQATKWGVDAGANDALRKHIADSLDDIHLHDSEYDEDICRVYIDPKEMFHDPLLIKIDYDHLFYLLDRSITDYSYKITIPESRDGFYGFEEESAKEAIRNEGFEELLK